MRSTPYRLAPKLRGMLGSILSIDYSVTRRLHNAANKYLGCTSPSSAKRTEKKLTHPCNGLILHKVGTFGPVWQPEKHGRYETDAHSVPQVHRGLCPARQALRQGREITMPIHMNRRDILRDAAQPAAGKAFSWPSPHSPIVYHADRKSEQGVPCRSALFLLACVHQGRALMRKTVSSLLFAVAMTLPGCAPIESEAPAPSNFRTAAERGTDQIDFYDERGCPVAYTEDGTHIFTFGGRPVAYLDGESVYSFSGTHLGWFEDGWIRDNGGRCVFYTHDAQGGPVKPVEQVKPVKSVKSVSPVKSVGCVRPVKAVKSLSWSRLSGEQFFQR